MTDAPPGAAPPPAPVEVKANAAPIVTRETFTVMFTAVFALAADRLVQHESAIVAIIPVSAILAVLVWRLWQSLCSWRVFRDLAHQVPFTHKERFPADSTSEVTH